MTQFTIVVPVYNEESSIRLFYDEITKVIRADFPNGPDVALLFVDDGSHDQTLPLIKDLAANDDRVSYLSFSRNFGKESAILAGLDNAHGDYIAIMDGDLQDPPQELARLYQAVASGDCDVARMRRVDRQGEPVIRSLAARMFYKLFRSMCKLDLADGARDYMVMNRKVADSIISMREYNRFFKGLVSWVGFTCEWFEFTNTARQAGESHWSFTQLVSYALEAFSAFSVTPLLISSVCGYTCFFASIIMIIFIVVRTLLFGDPVSGWPSTICIIFLLGGIQLISIGVLGQYLAKTYMETKRRPSYLIQEQRLPDDIEQPKLT